MRISIIIALCLLLTGCTTVAKRYDDGTLTLRGNGEAHWADGTKIIGKPLVRIPDLPPLELRYDK